MKTKQQVFALAKKHNIDIEGHTDMYWHRAECEWDAPFGKSFGGRHCSVYEASIGIDVNSAKEFWNHMFEDLSNDIKYLQDCDCRDCGVQD